MRISDKRTRTGEAAFGSHQRLVVPMRHEFGAQLLERRINTEEYHFITPYLTKIFSIALSDNMMKSTIVCAVGPISSL
jgi:hypothetical protein